jgi:hypothetical protein
MNLEENSIYLAGVQITTVKRHGNFTVLSPVLHHLARIYNYNLEKRSQPMKKGSVLVLVIAGIMVLCGLILIVGGMLPPQHGPVARQSAYGFVVSMRTSSMIQTTQSPSLMFLILGCTLLNSGVTLLVLGVYLLVKVKPRQTSQATQKKSETPKAEATATKKELDDVVDVEEKQ